MSKHDGMQAAIESVYIEEELKERRKGFLLNRTRTPILAMFIAAFLVMNTSIFTVLATSESLELSYDDGEKDGDVAYGGAGHAVRLTPATKMWIIEGIKVYGNRYGDRDQKAQILREIVHKRQPPTFFIQKKAGFKISEDGGVKIYVVYIPLN